MFTKQIDENTYLKLLEPHHARQLFAVTDSSRKSLRTWLPWVDFIETPGQSEEFIHGAMKQYGENNGFQAGIWFKEDLAGVIGLHKIDWPNRSTSVGYWLGEAFTGRGLMTKACREVVDHCFIELELQRVEIRAASENRKSSAVPKRLGFEYEGCLRGSEKLYDNYVDHYVYGMLRPEWVNKG
ncbi:GNAT family N-acetyltransferase [Alkalicoccus saliphilus]|uniref:RimJ/RimL family protein N-acetyltransferase n=1 Tax=Alkalicoccus saliphilus TaxID=200989 RepID=A0A2T4U9R0_9BACI|nr:GNAT family protein [Alkalicoccus saliphilus]PTL40120.1 RimJ/RimL family protein N-acetyltransferase [Alkalicoccus saliphilus]